jgi:uncharacterized repeat protein (TIGR04076 family)
LEAKLTSKILYYSLLKDFEMEIVVKEIKGTCPVFKIGDKIVIEGPKINLQETDNLCIHALPSILHYSLALREGADPVALGLSTKKNRAYIQCVDPWKPYTKGGTVIFEFILE